MNKRLLALFSVIVIASMALAACSGGAPTTAKPTAPAQPTEQVEVGNQSSEQAQPVDISVNQTEPLLTCSLPEGASEFSGHLTITLSDKSDVIVEWLPNTEEVIGMKEKDADNFNFTAAVHKMGKFQPFPDEYLKGFYLEYNHDCDTWMYYYTP